MQFTEVCVGGGGSTPHKQNPLFFFSDNGRSIAGPAVGGIFTLAVIVLVPLPLNYLSSNIHDQYARVFEPENRSSLLRIG
jgi:hypothetical protein